jgi:hypothetical protein
MDAERHPELAADLLSDDDRTRVLDILRRHTGDGRLTLEDFSERADLVLHARTYAELVPATRGLPSLPPPRHDPTPTTPRPRRWIVGVFGGGDLRGRWRADRDLGVLAIFGTTTVDVCEAELHVDELEITAISVLGGAEVIVPQGVPVEVCGTSFLGSRQVKVHGEAVAGAPLLRVRGYTVLGGLTVRTHRNKRRHRR